MRKQERITRPPKYRLGAACAISMAFPCAVLLSLFYRFPFPISGYMSGDDTIIGSLISVVFYGIFTAGFFILGLLGALGARILNAIVIQEKYMLVSHLLLGTFIAFLWTGSLAIIDKVIGPWVVFFP